MSSIIHLFILIGLFLFSPRLWSQFSSSSTKSMMWNGVEVVYLEDNSLPLYSMSIHFADGALSDGRSPGLTQATFDLLSSGTRRFNQKEISSNLEFFGASYGGRVTHEFVSYGLSGLAKDFIPTLKKVCHLFHDASFPKREVKKYKVQARNALNSLVSGHRAMASRAFREISLKGTPYSYPVGGKISDLKKIGRRKLLRKLKYFNQTVKKRIYISGPKELLAGRRVIQEECGWSGNAQFVRAKKWSYAPKKKKRPSIFLVTVPKANQAQIRWGRALGPTELENPIAMAWASNYLGGGFSSLLMREIRVKRGLSYGAYANVGRQRDYGRAIISTSTKNPSVLEVLKVIDSTVKSGSDKNKEKDALALSKSNLQGSYLFQFERPSAFLDQLAFIDHTEQSRDVIFDFPNKLKRISEVEITNLVSQYFSAESSSIVIIGSKKLIGQLKKFGNLKVYSYKKFL